MTRATNSFNRSRRSAAWAMIVAATVTTIAGCSGPTGRAYSTPEAGAEALANALRAGNPSEVDDVLGDGAWDALSTGDEVADRLDRLRFVEAYTQRSEIVEWDDGAATLMVGQDEWPMPVPLVRRSAGWQFDLESGKDEIIARRIGRNELYAIDVCRAVVDAQREYLASTGVYAGQFLSDPGARNGLYWPTAPGEAPSPLGQLLANASEEGYGAGGHETGEPRPYHGYRYRMLTEQGEHAPGGARDLHEGARLTRGFGVVAYPASYGDSGIMTFIVGRNGVVYERDLGANTPRTAGAMRAFDPDPRWTVVMDTVAETP